VKILSTKKLSSDQRDIVSDFQVEEVAMIDIFFGKNLEINERVKNAIFTSSNSVRSVFEVNKIEISNFEFIFCVGEKTKVLLESFGLVVDICAKNANELAYAILDMFAANTERSFKEISWFCGNLRNNELPVIIAEHGLLVTEYLVYETKLNTILVQEDYDAILFYSPSGVKAYLKLNKPNSNPVVCIGSTTAIEAIEFFDNVYISDKTTVESVIEKVKEIL